MKKIIPFFFLFINTISGQKNDTARALPHFEITSTRLGRYAIGQQQNAFDSADLASFENRNLVDLIQNLTPLSIRDYGMCLASVVSRGLAILPNLLH